MRELSVCRVALIAMVAAIWIGRPDVCLSQAVEWEHAGFGHLPVIDVKAHPSGNLYAIVESELFRLSEPGADWESLDVPHYNFPQQERAIRVGRTGTIYVLRRSNIFRSEDGGNTWSLFLTEIWDGGQYFGVFDLVEDAAGAVYVTTVQEESPNKGHAFFYRTLDGGISWQSRADYGYVYSVIVPFAVASIAPSVVLVGNYIGMLATTDGGDSWFRSGLENVSIREIVLSESGDIYAGSFNNGIYISADEGHSWTDITGDLDDIRITTIVIDRQDNLFVGTEGGGVFRSTDQGNTWISFNGGLTNLAIRSLSVGVDGILYAATEGGLFRTSESISTGFDHEGSPERSFMLYQNYPNPFNPGTVIPFELRSLSHVRLAIYDLLGREVAVLVDGFRQAGRHEVGFDAAHLPSGVYQYRIEAESGRQARSMVLFR